MRVLMLGRGVIATIYGHALEDAGHDVRHYVRPGRTAEYGDAVRMELVDGRRAPFGRRSSVVSRTRLVEAIGPDDEFELVVLSVGHHRLREAAATLAPVVGAATVLVLGNIWDEPLDAVLPLPADQVVFGFPGAGGGFDADGVLHGALTRSITIGVSAETVQWRGRDVRAAFGWRASPSGTSRTCEDG